MSIKNLIAAIETHFNAVVTFDDGMGEYAKTLHITPEGFELGFEMYVDNKNAHYSNLDSDNIEEAIYLVGCKVATEKMATPSSDEISWDY